MARPHLDGVRKRPSTATIATCPTTIWEAAIKQSIGKLDKLADLAERLRDSGFRHPNITAERGIVAGRLST